MRINVLSSEPRESKKGNTYYQNTIMLEGGEVGKVLTQNKLPLGEHEMPVRFKNDNFLNLVLAIDERNPE